MIELRDLRKSYKTGDFVQKALDGVSVTFRDSEFVAILGPSGSGKTTLLNVVGGLDHADSGDLVINGVSTKDYGSKDWDTYRNHHVGFVFQSYNLIPHQTILSNVELALTLSGVGRAERRRRAKEALERVGLGEHIHKHPSQLSGGQMQRVAIARALVNDPDIVLADEPTGALDAETGIQVMDLLAEVARDRLVVMVTHNPDLARQYATRIVNIADGRITGDSDPITPAELDATTLVHKDGVTGIAATSAVAGPEGPVEDAVVIPRPEEAKGERSASKKADRKASMSFLTALSLSFSNLMAKKGRTILTAFAGSIGIMGIAAILALSNGVNNYIDKVQEDALSSSPLTITKSSFDVSSIMTQAAGYSAEGGESRGDESGASTEDRAGQAAGSDTIPESTIMSDILTDIKNNDLESFRTYLESGESDVKDHVTAITYNYGITPQVYASDTSDGVKQLNPSTLQGIMSNGMSSMMMAGASSSAGFQEMLDDQAILDAQYDVVKGTWPKKYDECVLVLSSSGGISDYTLYSLGVLDPEELSRMLNSAIKSEKVDVPDADVDFTYDDAMDLNFRIVNQADLYTRSEDGATWTDRSSDEAYMKNLVDQGLELHVVGVVRPKGTASATSLGEGIAYRHDLITHLMAEAADSEIVRAQLANPDVDVFTGKTFDELQDAQNAQLDMSSLFSVDESKIAQAFTIDQSALTADGIDASAFDFSNIDMGSVTASATPNKEEIAKSVMSTLATNMPAPDFADLGYGDLAEPLSKMGINSLSDLASISDAKANPTMMTILQQYPEVAGRLASLGAVADAYRKQVDLENTNSLFKGYLQYVKDHGSEGKSYSQMMSDYLVGDGKAALDAIVAVAGDNGEATRAGMTKYLTNTVAPSISAALATAQATATSQATEQMMTGMQQQLAQVIAQQMTDVMGQQMARFAAKLQNAIHIDGAMFASAISVNMDQDDLTSLLVNYMNREELTYDNNLIKLGYADEDKPESINIYAKSFDDKQVVEDIIADYNDQVEAAGEADKSISYSDITGVLMKSVTSIINMISLVLIAFVSVSLVVSSIMIGIITYISVLERKKEIGILRAMGASKLNVANIFNAETFIEGLLAGMLAIAVVYIASVPVNAMVLRDHNVANILALPPGQALILILISVVLTLVAGLIPSTAAARRDPVEALRSE
ncbi:MAG: ABC transporter ATP-binding protein/permease [Olegusella sp.]|nr:ABC transporter ATP-binding protein/permease [Olegusella sp.]